LELHRGGGRSRTSGSPGLQEFDLRQVNHDYTVFVHIVHEDGNVYAHQDSKPQEGASPTVQWKAGQVILDTHTLQIDIEGPREGYHIEIKLIDTVDLEGGPGTSFCSL
jgi:hypothetical protein